MKRVALVALTLLLGGCREAQPARARESPQLALLTSLPLVFGEQFGLAAPASPALRRLERGYRIVPIAIADAASLRGQRLLLMAHPRAQPAEVLVALDRWVRAGGGVLLLADPKLDWPSSRPLGDRLRPPPFFADTGLLGHWGLTLAGPTSDGPQTVRAGGREIRVSSPGQLTSRSATCRVEPGRLIARCRIGHGAATVIADADFLNVVATDSGDASAANLELLAAELARFDRDYVRRAGELPQTYPQARIQEQGANE